RSSPLAGGAVLALMTLPTIIIAGRASIRAVPPSIRDAALGLGASKLQTSTHHVLPLAMPGILTGSIIGMAQALGETAPLLLVGMNSFIQEPPADPLSPGNVLPTLIYQWNSNSERLFDDKTAAAISVLLIFLILMNALAVLLRKRFERRW
ncbi:MAG: ABC transporter permease subunit, partial [Pseudomonadota bacterium]